MPSNGSSTVSLTITGMQRLAMESNSRLDVGVSPAGFRQKCDLQIKVSLSPHTRKSCCWDTRILLLISCRWMCTRIHWNKLGDSTLTYACLGGPPRGQCCSESLPPESPQAHSQEPSIVSLSPALSDITQKIRDNSYNMTFIPT